MVCSTPDILPIRTDIIVVSTLDIVLIDLPSQRPESYAFSVPLTSVYSLLVHPPSLSSWCKLIFNPNYRHLKSVSNANCIRRFHWN